MKINKTDEIENLTIFHHLGLHIRRQKCLVPFLSLDGTKIGNYLESKSLVFFLRKRSEKRLNFSSIFESQNSDFLDENSICKNSSN